MATALEAAARLRRSEARPLLTHAALDMLTARSRMSMRKIREELGYAPRYGVEEAMAELAAYWTRCGRQAS
jgi:nucleoside-diphosphate-sugar epimerase